MRSAQAAGSHTVLDLWVEPDPISWTVGLSVFCSSFLSVLLVEPDPISWTVGLSVFRFFLFFLFQEKVIDVDAVGISRSVVCRER
jgi:hypothetical protein